MTSLNYIGVTKEVKKKKNLK